MKFEDVPANLLRWSKPCKKGHCGPNKKGLRTIKHGICLACRFNLPDGEFAHDFGDEVQDIGSWAQYTDKAKHIERCTQWQKENPEKHREAVVKYNSKPEVKKYLSGVSKQNYNKHVEEYRLVARIFDKIRRLKKELYEAREHLKVLRKEDKISRTSNKLKAEPIIEHD